MYYGAADTVVCLAEASLNTLLDHLEEHPWSLASDSLRPMGMPESP